MTKMQNKYTNVSWIWLRLDLTDFHSYLILCSLIAEDREDLCAYRNLIALRMVTITSNKIQVLFLGYYGRESEIFPSCPAGYHLSSLNLQEISLMIVY